MGRRVMGSLSRPAGAEVVDVDVYVYVDVYVGGGGVASGGGRGAARQAEDEGTQPCGWTRVSVVSLPRGRLVAGAPERQSSVRSWCGPSCSTSIPSQADLQLDRGMPSRVDNNLVFTVCYGLRLLTDCS